MTFVLSSNGHNLRGLTGREQLHFRNGDCLCRRFSSRKNAAPQPLNCLLIQYPVCRRVPGVVADISHNFHGGLTPAETITSIPGQTGQTWNFLRGEPNDASRCTIDLHPICCHTPVRTEPGSSEWDHH